MNKLYLFAFLISASLSAMEKQNQMVGNWLSKNTKDSDSDTFQTQKLFLATAENLTPNEKKEIEKEMLNSWSHVNRTKGRHTTSQRLHLAESLACLKGNYK